MNRFERRRERTRRDLLASATRVLAKKGLHDTKVADIAAAADIGVGTFYLHFPTKDALFDAVVEETAPAALYSAYSNGDACPFENTRWSFPGSRGLSKS